MIVVLDGGSNKKLHIAGQGRTTKIGQGGNFPPPPGHDFCPLWASFSTFSTQLKQDIIYKFILTKSSGGGTSPP